LLIQKEEVAVQDTREQEEEAVVETVDEDEEKEEEETTTTRVLSCHVAPLINNILLKFQVKASRL